MQKVTLCFLLFSSSICRGQIFTVSADKGSALYKGVENPLTVVAYNVPPANLIVKTTCGKITGKNGYYVYYSDTGSVANISVFKRTKQGEDVIGVYTFPLRQIYDLQAKIAGKPGGNIPIAVLKGNRLLTTDTDDFDFEKGPSVISFTLSILRKNEYISKEIKNNGGKFNEEVISALQKVMPGDAVIFRDIFATRLDKTTTILNPLTFTVTD